MVYQALTFSFAPALCISQPSRSLSGYVHGCPMAAEPNKSLAKRCAELEARPATGSCMCCIMHASCKVQRTAVALETTSASEKHVKLDDLVAAGAWVCNAASRVLHTGYSGAAYCELNAVPDWWWQMV
jgi:hypothetical protein